MREGEKLGLLDLQGSGESSESSLFFEMFSP